MNQPQTKTREQPRFPLALKRARLARQLKQATLAGQLHVKLRTLVSWETGSRIPSIGIVALLTHLLTGSLDLENDLILAYIADDLDRQVHLQEDEQFRRLALRTAEQFQQSQVRRQKPEHEAPLSLFTNQLSRGQQEHSQNHQQVEPVAQRQGSAPDDPLQQLFIMLDKLRDHGELIPVVLDFLQEVTMSNEQ